MSTPKHKQGRPTIGLFTYGMRGTVAVDMWLGVSDAARERGANVLCFPGGLLGEDTLWASAESNVLYELAGAENVDGLVIWSGAVLYSVDLEAARAFCAQYDDLPVVSVALPLSGMVNLVADNYQPVRQAVDHLIEVHGYRRIGFLRGPEGHQEASERYRGYVDGLGEHGIAVDPDLIVPGNYGYDKPAGAAAVEFLLDGRELSPGVDFDALVAANDEMALGMLEVLQGRGIRVPDEVAVVGFNDGEEASAVTPPLTTVRYSFYEMGQRATELLLDQIEGRQVSEETVVPLRLIVRESCGCLDPAVAHAAIDVAAPLASESTEAASATWRSRVLRDVVETFGDKERGVAPGQVERLLDSFIAEVGAASSESPAGFLGTLDGILREVMVAGGGSSISAGEHVAAWQDAVSVLRRYTLPHLVGEALIQATNLWEQARVMIGRAERRAEAQRALRKAERADMLQEINQMLTTTPDEVGLTRVLARELPRLGIPSAYLVLYESKESTGWSRLIMGYDGAEQIDAEERGQRFPSRWLAPEGMLPQDRPYSLVVEPLYYLERQLGLVLLEMGPREGEVYHTLRGEISSALQGVRLTEQIARRAVQLQTAAEVSRSTGTMMEPSELIQQVVELIRERFDLYYVR